MCTSKYTYLLTVHMFARMTKYDNECLRGPVASYVRNILPGDQDGKLDNVEECLPGSLTSYVTICQEAWMARLTSMRSVKPLHNLNCTYIPGGQDGEVAYDDEGEASP
jgi:hypothetical protein